MITEHSTYLPSPGYSLTCSVPSSHPQQQPQSNHHAATIGQDQERCPSAFSFPRASYGDQSHHTSRATLPTYVSRLFNSPKSSSRRPVQGGLISVCRPKMEFRNFKLFAEILRVSKQLYVEGQSIFGSNITSVNICLDHGSSLQWCFAGLKDDVGDTIMKPAHNGRCSEKYVAWHYESELQNG
jgi:hypothetical protein